MRAVNIIASIFGFLCSIGGLLVLSQLVMLPLLIFGGAAHWTILIETGIILFLAGLIGSFSSGIVQIVLQIRAKEKDGLMTVAGILNLFGGVFFVGPIFSLVCAIRGSKS